MRHSINQMATIYKTDGTELMKCRYDSHTEERILLYISLPEFFVLSNLHEDVLVELTSPTLGLVPYVCSVLPETLVGTNEATAQHMQLTFLIREKKENIQRRRDFKVKTEIPVEVKLTHPRTGKCQGRIEDISATGILFATEEQLAAGQEFTFSFTETKTPMQLTARILNQYRYDKIKRYGCILLDLPKEQEEILRQYVFQTEAKRR